MSSVTERLLRYVSFDTISDPNSPTCPSTAKQRLLGAELVEDMLALGITDAHMDADGYVYGSVAGNPAKPAIGLIAHMDTSPDVSGTNVKARVVAYDGPELCLNEEKGIRLCESDYPDLKASRGKHLVVTDGTTLLGADDKAGVAEILAAVEIILAHGGDHAPIKIGFTPDEEIGRGADRFDVPGFAADYAYTMDGGTVGEIVFENFNAAEAKVTVNGRNIHPGSAKNKMVNSMRIAMAFESMLPVFQRPEHTEGYEGFIHLNGFEGNVETTHMHYIVRDHNWDKFQAKKRRMESVAAYLNEIYGEGTVVLTLRDTYYNMRQKIEPCMYIIDRAKDAMRKAGMTPIEAPIRGGTDGARLSFEGLPCPNLCTGGHNFHSRFEYAVVEDMEQCVDMIVNLICDTPNK